MAYLLGPNRQSANCGGNPLCQATKQHLTAKQLKTMKNEMRSEITYLFGLSYGFSVQCLEECWHEHLQTVCLCPNKSAFI